MIRATLRLALLICSFIGPYALAHGQDTKPNIIFIMADDLGNADLGYRGSDIKTPNIDKLAKEGVRLESFHGMPVCTPARAALMTGRYPMRYGLQTLVIFPNHTYGLPTDERTLPQALKEAGYQHLDGRQMAPGPCRPEVLAAEPRVRSFLRQPRRRGGLFHQDARRHRSTGSATGNSSRRRPTTLTSDRRRSRQADREAGQEQAVLPVLRVAGPACALSGTEGR